MGDRGDGAFRRVGRRADADNDANTSTVGLRGGLRLPDPNGSPATATPAAPLPAAPQTAPGGGVESTAVVRKTPKKSNLASNFSQQKLRAWQPVLTPKWVISVFLGFGAIFIALGIVLLTTSNRVVECSLSYDDPERVCSDPTLCTTILTKQMTADNCVGPSPNKISGPVFVYYQLSNFYQNHRRYVKSRNDEQLRGNFITSASDLSSCDPIITDALGRVLHPCGLIAWSVFNDTYTLDDANGPITLDDSASTIAWSTDVDRKFRNPTESDQSLVYEWLNEDIFPGKVENGHFIVWMRNAALPTFRKLYARIDSDVEMPITITINNRYPVSGFNGGKSIYISTTSWLGGRNSFLGIAYFVIGSWCLVFGMFFVSKNYQSPRILGDVRYLNWVGYRRN